MDASLYSHRAAIAAKQLMPVTPVEVINAQTTGSQPRGYTCRHFACEGSDKSFMRREIVEMLLAKKADMEARTAKGSTPMLLASAIGVTDVVQLLIASRADIAARNDHDNGGAPNDATVFWRHKSMPGRNECANDEVQ